MKEELMEQDLKQEEIILRNFIKSRYRISLGTRIINGIESFAEFFLVLFAIPFLTLIRIFEIMFLRKPKLRSKKK